MTPGIRYVCRSKKSLTVAGVLLFALAACLTAFAFWTATGSGTASGTTGTLAAPPP